MKLFTGILTEITDRPILREFVRPAGIFLLLLIVAATGFSTLDNVGFIDGLFWLIDPGGITQYFRTHDGPETRVKAFAIFTLVLLVLTGLWMVETGLSAIFGGQIHAEIRDMKIKQHIDDLSGHVIVCGHGTFGRTIVSQLRERNRDVVIIEQEESYYERSSQKRYRLLMVTSATRKSSKKQESHAPALSLGPSMTPRRISRLLWLPVNAIRRRNS